VNEAVVEGRALLQKHARSFRIAARVLGDAQADDAAVAYGFCRLADDAVDEAPDAETAAAAIAAIQAELRGERPARPLVAAWLEMAKRRGIPIFAAEHLVTAIAGDVGAVRVEDDRALLRYAYGVAGTVGLMMAPILGATDPDARPHAVDLGIAMQLTNIARDVAEDAAKGRAYLPADRLRKAGIDPEGVAAGQIPEATAVVVADLVQLAEGYYASAASAAKWLPARGRLAMLLALHLYRAIGHAVVRRGSAALNDRTVLGTGGLALAVGRALLAWIWPAAAVARASLYRPEPSRLTTDP
jgi:phytoene synthase